MIWEKGIIRTIRGEEEGVLPVIVSASRATDIPAFYSRWFMERLRQGYAVRYNPFNGRREVIGFARTRVFVFWSKYPAPMLKYLDDLDQMGVNYYFLYTVNNYPEYEPHVPALEERINVFRQLSRRLGPDRVVWRYDPLILSDTVDEDELIRRVRVVGEALQGYTRRLIFSFVDLSYRKVQRNLQKAGQRFYAVNEQDQRQIVERIHEMAQEWGMEMRSCASSIDFSSQGVRPGKCIDDELMVRLFPHDNQLMDFLGYSGSGKYVPSKKLKDRGQRKFCGCVYSKDIGRYQTCPFNCVYCYANGDFEKTRLYFAKHNYLNESL